MTEIKAKYRTKSKSSEAGKGAFVPNAYQTPNAYVDDYLALFTGEEWKALSYATRRILGFNKRRDRISLSQFANGIKDSEGNPLDFGCGLSVNTLRSVLKNLCNFGFLIQTQENDYTKNEGPEYELQWDDSRINLSAMLARDKKTATMNQVRTKKAVKIMRARRKQYPLMSHDKGKKADPLPSDDRPPLMSHDRHPLTSDDNTINRDKQRYTDINIGTAEIEAMTVKQVAGTPEMKLFEKVTGRFPGHFQWATIILFIRDKQLTEESMKPCWDYWKIKGYRANDLSWLVEWTQTGIPYKTNGAKNGNNSANSSYGKTRSSNRTGRTSTQRQGESGASVPAALSPSDQAVADRINARRRARREGAKPNV